MDEWASKFPLKEMRKLRFLSRRSLTWTRCSTSSASHPLRAGMLCGAPPVWPTDKLENSRPASKQSLHGSGKRSLCAAELQTADFSEHLLRASIEELRRLTRARANEVMEPVQKICAAAGLAVVWVPELPHCAISGCARWLSDRKALIALTLRYKTDDQMWFTFFHEVGHVLLHRKETIIRLG